MASDTAILLVRLKSLGDVLFTLPAAHALRAAFPQRRLSFLVSKEYEPLVQAFSPIDSVLTLDRASFRSGKPKAIVGEVLKLWRALRPRRFGLVVDFQGYGETAFLSWLSGAPQRWGTLYRPGRRWAYSQTMERNRQLHPAANNLALLQAGGLALGAVQNHFRLPEAKLREGRAFLAQQGLQEGRPTLFIQPFTSSAQKDWPLEGYLHLARHWQSQGRQVLFGGGPAERAALEPVRQAGFSVSAGAPLLVSAALTGLSTVVVGGDTGLLHLAVALGKRVVMLMGSAGPGSCHPFEHPDWSLVPQPAQPVASLSVETVQAACAQALAQSQAQAG